MSRVPSRYRRFVMSTPPPVIREAEDAVVGLHLNLRQRHLPAPPPSPVRVIKDFIYRLRRHHFFDLFHNRSMFEEVMKETEASGAVLPSDMLEAAKTMGIRKDILYRDRFGR